MVEIEVWTKEMETATKGVSQDMYLGSCSLTYDQLKVGNGVNSYFPILKDNLKIGKVFIRSQFNNDADAEFLDVLIASQKIEDIDDGCLISTTNVNHELSQARVNKSFHNSNAAASVFADPLADWKASMAKTYDS